MRILSKLVFPGLLLLALSACSNQSDQPEVYGNPPAPGFNETGSDPKAIAFADEVMEAVGGRKVWDDTRYIRWNFFGRRLLLWDKQNQRVRIEIPETSSVYLIDLKSETGKIMEGGQIMEAPDSLEKYTQKGISAWINDSYWLVMPMKLKDSGVTLRYLGQDTTLTGSMSDVLQLTFEEVGRTPENKYHIFVDKESRLVTQWSYFPQATDETPRFTVPWEDYNSFGGLLLSGDRGNNKLSEIAVYSEVPEVVFNDFGPYDQSQFK